MEQNIINFENIALEKDKFVDVFEKIYKNTSGFVYNTALRITGSQYISEEVTQEVFLKVYKNFSKFRAESDVKTWLYRITVNASMDVLKKHNREKKYIIDFDNSIFDIAGRHNEAESKLKEDYINDMVQKLLNKLTYEQRTCIVLRDVEGLSYEQIAGALKLNLNTVRTRLKRARERLIEIYEKEVHGNEL